MAATATVGMLIASLALNRETPEVRLTPAAFSTFLFLNLVFCGIGGVLGGCNERFPELDLARKACGEAGCNRVVAVDDVEALVAEDAEGRELRAPVGMGAAVFGSTVFI